MRLSGALVLRGCVSMERAGRVSIERACFVGIERVCVLAQHWQRMYLLPFRRGSRSILSSFLASCANRSTASSLFTRVSLMA